MQWSCDNDAMSACVSYVAELVVLDEPVLVHVEEVEDAVLGGRMRERMRERMRMRERRKDIGDRECR